MKIYQSFHKYPKHIELFERNHGINDESELTFEELRQLILADGYASTYILKPAYGSDSDQVFYTLWDYERLQKLWANENNLKTTDLQEIRFAQIEEYRPDVFYDFSAVYYKGFLQKYKLPRHIKKVYWNGFITAEPIIDTDYDAMITLYRPFVKYGEVNGFPIFELQPAFHSALEKYENSLKSIDLLIYGQYTDSYFNKRNDIIKKVLDFSLKSQLNIRIHLDVLQKTLKQIRIPRIGTIKLKTFPSKKVLKYTLPPLFGSDLYSTIGKTKFVLNAFPDNSDQFKSNMRMFEALNCGSLLISESGNYPEGFLNNKSKIEFSDLNILLKNLNNLVEDHQAIRSKMEPYINDLKKVYSKDNQWNSFKEIINHL